MFVLKLKGVKRSPKQRKAGKIRSLKNRYSSKIKKERVSVPGSKEKKGSLTVEAALALPVFFLALSCLIYLLEIQSVRFSIHNAAQNAAKKAAVETAALPVLNPWKLEADIVNLIGTDRMERSVIEGGSNGLSCWLSYFDENEGLLNINVWYKIRLPFPQFLNLTLNLSESFQVKAWTGYQRPQMAGMDDRIVYITDYGMVYHEDYQCRYLQLSIHYVSAEDLPGLRNLDGSIYTACEQCVYAAPMTGVYITDYGNKYHYSLNCSGLRRTIRAVKKSEAAGRSACSKCAQ